MRTAASKANSRVEADRERSRVAETFRRKSVGVTLIVLFIAILVTVTMSALAQQDGGDSSPEAGGRPASESGADTDKEVARSDTGVIVLSAAIVMAAALLATGYAVATVGSAALGAASEKPELIVRALVFVALAEGIAVWGLIVAVMLIGKL